MASGDLSFFYATGQLGAAAADLYEVPSGKTLMHAELILFNTDLTNAYRPDVHIASALGGAVNDANQIVGGVAGTSDIAAGETLTFQINQHPPAGYTFRGLADTGSKITYFLSGELREN